MNPSKKKYWYLNDFGMQNNIARKLTVQLFEYDMLLEKKCYIIKLIIKHWVLKKRSQMFLFSYIKI